MARYEAANEAERLEVQQDMTAAVEALAQEEAVDLQLHREAAQAQSAADGAAKRRKEKKELKKTQARPLRKGQRVIGEETKKTRKDVLAAQSARSRDAAVSRAVNSAPPVSRPTPGVKRTKQARGGAASAGRKKAARYVETDEDEEEDEAEESGCNAVDDDDSDSDLRHLDLLDEDEEEEMEGREVEGEGEEMEVDEEEVHPAPVEYSLERNLVWDWDAVNGIVVNRGPKAAKARMDKFAQAIKVLLDVAEKEGDEVGLERFESYLRLVERARRGEHIPSEKFRLARC